MSLHIVVFRQHRAFQMGHPFAAAKQAFKQVAEPTLAAFSVAPITATLRGWKIAVNEVCGKRSFSFR